MVLQLQRSSASAFPRPGALSTARLALSPRCGMKATCPLGPSILCGVTRAYSFAIPCSLPTLVPWGKSWLGVDCTEGQGGEGLRREGGTGDSDPWNRVAQRDSSTPVSLPLLFFCCSFLLWRVAEKMSTGADAPSHLQGKCSGEYTVHLI